VASAGTGCGQPADGARLSRAPARRSVTVDLHCHIIPGVDDGALDLDDAVAMARQAEADGIGAVCGTPHVRHDHDVRISELPARRAELDAAIIGAGCATQILPGGEVASTAVAGLNADELAAVSLGGARRWILLEPAPGPLDDRLDDAVDKLRAQGYRALIAHPERHLAGDSKLRLARLIGAGALVQATAWSFIDRDTRDGMLALAGAGLIHVLGSDSHSARAGRPVVITPALGVLVKVSPVAEHLEWIARTAPAAIVAGYEIRPQFAPLR
jgi:protein-tyrosine phosphatase